MVAVVIHIQLLLRVKCLKINGVAVCMGLTIIPIEYGFWNPLLLVVGVIAFSRWEAIAPSALVVSVRRFTFTMSARAENRLGNCLSELAHAATNPALETCCI